MFKSMFSVLFIVLSLTAVASDLDKGDTLKSLDAILASKMTLLSENQGWNTKHQSTIESLQVVLEALVKPYDTANFKTQVQNESAKVQGLLQLLKLGGVENPKNVLDMAQVAKASKIDDIRSLREFVQELNDRVIPGTKTKELSKQAGTYFTQVLSIIDTLAKKGEVEGVDPIVKLKREVAALGRGEGPYPTISKRDNSWQVTPLRPTNPIADLIKVIDETRGFVEKSCPTIKEITTQTAAIDSLIRENTVATTLAKSKRDVGLEKTKAGQQFYESIAKDQLEEEIVALDVQLKTSKDALSNTRSSSLVNASDDWKTRERELVRRSWSDVVSFGILLDKKFKGLDKPLTIDGISFEVSKVYQMIESALITDGLSENFESKMHGPFAKIAETSIRNVSEDNPSFKGVELLSTLDWTKEIMTQLSEQGASVIITKLDVAKAKKLPTALNLAKQTALSERESSKKAVEAKYVDDLKKLGAEMSATKEKRTKHFGKLIADAKDLSEKAIVSINAQYTKTSTTLTESRGVLAADKAALSACLGDLGNIHSRVQKISHDTDDKSHFETLSKDISAVSDKARAVRSGR